jgi:predicted Na+-dependent transporter
MFVGETVLLPLFVGIALHRQWEVFSERIAPLARNAAFAILLPAALLILVRFSADFLALIGDGTLFVIALTVAAGLISGQVLGGPDPANRRALGDAAAARHPGLAAAIAQLNSNESRVLAAIVLYLFSSILFSMGYAWIAGQFKSRPLRKAHAPHP